MCGCFSCICVCVPSVCIVSSEAEKGIRFPENIVTDGCELLCVAGNQEPGSITRVSSVLNHFSPSIPLCSLPTFHFRNSRISVPSLVTLSLTLRSLLSLRLEK